MMTPQQFATLFIHHWEDGDSDDPDKTHSMRHDDPGNWTGGDVGQGVLVGSNHGVTPRALAHWRGLPVSAITVGMMHDLTIEEAVRIALSVYYQSPSFDKLPFNAVTAALFDFAYNAGAVQAVKTLQTLMSVTADGLIGPNTIRTFIAWCYGTTPNNAAIAFANARIAFYRGLVTAHPGKYDADLQGWIDRANYYTPNGIDGWWSAFNAA